MRKIMCVIFASCLVSACDSLSTDNLADRCDSLYEDLNAELTEGIIAHENGLTADDVIERFTPRIRKLTADIDSLRDDLAKGGERHHWQWPLLMRSESILKYETTLGKYPIGLSPSNWGKTVGEVREENKGQRLLPRSLRELGQVERSSFEDLKWFCNRVVAANMAGLETPDDPGLVVGFMGREMAAKRLDIMRAIKTDEELKAFQAYLLSIGIDH